MDAKTLKALNASIAKWDSIARAGNEDTPLGSEDCPLCHLFHRDWCDDCPVKKATGWLSCRTTPYEAALEARDRIPGRYSLIRLFLYGRRVEAFRKAAADEAAFLRALRPIGT